MKILKKNLKEGIIKVRIETPSDLWHLEKLVEPGDLLRSKTTRKIVINRGGEMKRGERKTMVLKVQAEKTELTDNAFRVTGKIKHGPEDIQLNSYHTLQLELYDDVDIQKKEWKRYHMERLKKAQKAEPLILICVLDRQSADFAMLKESGVERLVTIKSKDPEAREEYYAELKAYLEKKTGYNAIIIAGPGFERENLLKYMKAKKSSIIDKIHLEHASSTGISGINEVLKSSADVIINKTRISEETKIIEKLLEEINKDGLVIYGKSETTDAVNAGAVKTLLISEIKVRENEALMDTIEKMQGDIFVIGDDHTAGEQFLRMGGIAGFLRYRL